MTKTVFVLGTFKQVRHVFILPLHIVIYVPSPFMDEGDHESPQLPILCSCQKFSLFIIAHSNHLQILVRQVTHCIPVKLLLSINPAGVKLSKPFFLIKCSRNLNDVCLIVCKMVRFSYNFNKASWLFHSIFSLLRQSLHILLVLFMCFKSCVVKFVMYTYVYLCTLVLHVKYFYVYLIFGMYFLGLFQFFLPFG